MLPDGKRECRGRVSRRPQVLIGIDYLMVRECFESSRRNQTLDSGWGVEFCTRCRRRNSYGRFAVVINDLFADELIISSTALLNSGASYSARLLLLELLHCKVSLSFYVKLQDLNWRLTTRFWLLIFYARNLRLSNARRIHVHLQRREQHFYVRHLQDTRKQRDFTPFFKRPSTRIVSNYWIPTMKCFI